MRLASLYLPIFATCSLLALPVVAQQQTQIDQARLLTPGLSAAEARRPAPERGVTITAPEHADDAFGAQVLLKQAERPKPFSGFAEIGAFVTNNVALTPTDAREDSFLVATTGAGFTQRLGPTARLDLGARIALYRYGRFSELDFQSLDLTAGVAWAPEILHGAELVLRYTFTELTTRKDAREFFRNHAILLGVQKVIPFSRAHGVFVAASAQWSQADPEEAGRDEYVATAGYRAQITRSVDAELSYRYGRFIYREVRSRRDHNHAVSLSLRYAPRPWVALSATTFATWNRSTRKEFEYDAANLGVGAQVSIRF